MNDSTNNANDFMTEFERAADNLQTAVLELAAMQTRHGINLTVTNSLSHDFKQPVIAAIEQHQVRLQLAREGELRRAADARNLAAEIKAQEDARRSAAVYRQQQKPQAATEAAERQRIADKQQTQESARANRLAAIEANDLARARRQRGRFDEKVAQINN